MEYNKYCNIKGGIYLIKLICTILFCSFSFVYLYFYQADIFAVAQHILSNGATTYNDLIGAFIITVIFKLIQVGISSFFYVYDGIYALTYFPSAVLLSILSSISITDHGFMVMGYGPWLVAVLLVLWLLGCIIYKRRILNRANVCTHGKIFSLILWRNLMILSLIFLFVGLSGNNNTIIHYRLRMESYMVENQFSGALNVGEKSQESDAWLTMLRMYVMAREGKLADELFQYPISSTSSSDIIPMANGVRCLLYSNDSIYKFLGARPLKPMNTVLFMQSLLHSGLATNSVKDYLLCGFLLDKNLDGFVKSLPKYYDINGKLPKHYREALTLYTHIRSNPIIVYHDDIMDTDYEDMKTLEKKYKSSAARKYAIHDQYAGTYWWYYEYGY